MRNKKLRINKLIYTHILTFFKNKFNNYEIRIYYACLPDGRNIRILFSGLTNFLNHLNFKSFFVN